MVNCSQQISKISFESGRPKEDVKFSERKKTFAIFPHGENNLTMKNEVSDILGYQEEPNKDGRQPIDPSQKALKIAKNIYSDIYAKNSLGMPTTGKDLAKHLEELNDDNILDVMDYYNGNLIEDILSEVGIDSGKRADWSKRIVDLVINCRINHSQKYNDKDNQTTLNYLKETLNNEIDKAMGFPSFIFDPDKIKLLTKVILSDNPLDFDINQKICTKIINPKYTGKEYVVEEKSESLLQITDKATNKTISLNLAKLFENFPEEDAYCAIHRIKNLPAEVLVDIYNECNFTINSKNTSEKIFEGLYTSDDDKIAFKNNYFDSIIMAHEVGHAMDFKKSGNKNSSTFQKYEKIFLEELDNYNNSNILTHFFSSKKSDYCTDSIQEMFAECYTLLMLGNCYSKDCILKYFPRTLGNAQNHINDIRKPYVNSCY